MHRSRSGQSKGTEQQPSRAAYTQEPVSESQLSSVQGSPSSQKVAECMQPVSLLQESVVHALPSSQVSVKTQPLLVWQLSEVQARLSLQLIAVFRQKPHSMIGGSGLPVGMTSNTQESVVHALPSAQSVSLKHSPLPSQTGSSAAARLAPHETPRTTSTARLTSHLSPPNIAPSPRHHRDRKRYDNAFLDRILRTSSHGVHGIGTFYPLRLPCHSV